jgi:PIN domain nuclease of toxin-antitoxin system
LIARIATSPIVDVLPLTGKIAVESTKLGARFPSDPGDQIIAATARCYGLTLLTADQRIIDSGVVTVA